MDDVTIARALHVLAIVHWIGGVAMVTAVILPALGRRGEAAERLALFEAVEGKFSGQAKISTLLAGASGFYMTWRMDAWDRFLEPGMWWMHAMVAVWAIFSVILFVAEPLFLHRWFHERARRDPEGTFALVRRLHWVLLTASLITVAGAVLGAHGMLY
jgi:hypothetical protein